MHFKAAEAALRKPMMYYHIDVQEEHGDEKEIKQVQTDRKEILAWQLRDRASFSRIQESDQPEQETQAIFRDTEEAQRFSCTGKVPDAHR